MSNSISIYAPEVRALALREGMGELQAWRQINDRQKVIALMSEQRHRQVSQELAAMRMSATVPARKSFRARVWDRIENYFANRFDYS